jgi:hypothetical protein
LPIYFNEKIALFMTKSFFFAIVSITVFLFGLNGHAQNSLANEKEVFANAIDAEKIYLQLSGTTFNTAETIWFKAIVTDVIHHKPTTKSNVLHVELIDPLNNRIVDKNLLKIHNGIASGFFQLHLSYPEGNYIVRAYTEWNKNFGPDFISSIPIRLFRVQKADDKPLPIRDIVITKDLISEEFSLSSTITVKELDSLHKGDAMLYIQWGNMKDSIVIKQNKRKSIVSIQHKVPLNIPVINYQLITNNEVFSKSVVLDDEYGSLHFFPEGGSLVEGLKSVVGFKYLNYMGKGAEVLGIIEDGNGSKVAEFKSNSLGMGKVILLPKPRQNYYGVLTNKNGITYKYQLPKARPKGLVLSLVHKKQHRELRIWNKEKKRDSLYIKFFHRGQNLFFLKGKFKNGTLLYKIQSKKLPQGVIGFTVYDKDFKPVAERHFFNMLKQENLDIKVVTDTNDYKIRDSVQVSISTKINEKSVPASVSIMAVDSSYFYNTNLERNTIISYFLLQSDIKGTIENPSYYFQNNDNLTEIDLLMLTQGWSNYKYKDKKKLRRFNAEKGLQITGNVYDVHHKRKNKQQKSNYELNMLLLGQPVEAYIQKTDSSGYFMFMLKDSYGFGRKFVMQPSDASNKAGNLRIDIKKYEVPEISYEIEKIIAPVDSIIEKTMTAKIEEDIKLDPLLLPSAIVLDEVVLSSYKVTPERARMLELHGMPNVVIDNNELINKRKKWTTNLYRWLLFNYPKEMRIRRVGRFSSFEAVNIHGADWTYVVVDGVPVTINDYDLIGSIPVSAVESVEILRNPKLSNKYFIEVFNCASCTPPPSAAILAIYTYSGTGLFGTFQSKKTDLIHYTAPQFSPNREYYVPKYHDTSSFDWAASDRRTLLYWKSNIITDRNGKATVTFFNGDLIGKKVLICEGITSNGKIGYSEVFYKVEN